MSARIEAPALETAWFRREHEMPRHVPRGSFDLVAMKRRWDHDRPRRQKEVLDWLRAAFKEGELALVGWREILSWMHGIGFRNRIGRELRPDTVRQWVPRLGFPLLHGRRKCTKPFTTNYLILAWAMSLYRSGDVETPRIASGRPC